ncbi:tryptophan--tRNA ligase [bacterium]|nr:tryptophan--tRNA ligase [bacterium]
MRKKVLSGTRPTGDLHIGHLIGALSNWVKLQEDYDAYYFVADIHSFTNNLSTDKKNFYYSIVKDMLAAGLDPERSTIFVQSEVPEHAELATYLSMATPLSWVERCPTFKDAIRDLRAQGVVTRDSRGQDSKAGDEVQENVVSVGLLSYPILMTSDIVLYDADFVPVGKDQMAHLEISREIVRRFNHLFGETFVEPEGLLTKFPLLLGPDRRKMSKSYGNCISLNEEADVINKKVMSMITDPEKIRKDDPGHPEICNVFTYHKIFGTTEIDRISAECASGELGCVACKRNCAQTLSKILSEHQEKRNDLSDEEIRRILDRGREKAREAASAKIDKVKKNMGLII